MMHKKSALRHALGLEIFTVSWNVLEAFFAVGLGVYYNSIALVAFGADSLIEVAAAGVLTWRLLAEYRGDVEKAEDVERIEKRASFWVGVTFFVLAAYVIYESLEKLISRTPAEPGFWGLVIAGISVVVMPVLWRMKLRAADAVGSSALRSEAAETIICAYLSAVLLAGIAINYFFGIWWVDSVAALFMVYFIVREGLEAFEESREEDDDDDKD